MITGLRLWLYCAAVNLVYRLRPKMHLLIYTRVKPPSGLLFEGAVEAGEFNSMEVEWPIATPLGTLLVDQKGDMWSCVGRPKEEEEDDD